MGKGMRSFLQLALYPLFWLWLLVPLGRRWLRRAGWLADADEPRKRAERMGARHALPGGFCAAGLDGIGPGTPLALYLSAEEVLVATEGEPEQIRARYRLGSLEQITVDGESYQPKYVSFAKEPPKREQLVDRNAVSRLALRFGEASVELEYRGAFARHLAESAANALHQMREASGANEIAGQPPKVFHVVR